MSFRRKLHRLITEPIFVILLAFASFLAFIPFFTYLYFAKDLTTKEGIMNRNDTGLILLDRNDQPFFTFYEAKFKTFVPLADIPLHMQQAVIAVEDKEFYQHPGFSIRGIARSIIINLKKKDIIYGGSTITQQLVKNSLLYPKKSFLRKYQEVILAQEIERQYSKNEILEMYLNSVYFGEGAFGIEEAAQKYFAKNAKDLAISESAILAALLPSPSRLSPLSNGPENIKKQQSIVLDAMYKQGLISQDQKVQAENSSVAFAMQKREINAFAPHFALFVKDELIEKYGEESVARSGFKVRTSLDLELQKYAETVVKNQVARLAVNKASNGAAVIIDPTSGEILVMVGSYDWYDEKDGKVNMTLAPRQPGSAFKPIVYAKAFEERLITPATVLKDQPTVFERNYKPENYDKRFRGNVLARRALANSLNVPSVSVMEKVGIYRALEMARRMGITTLKNPSDYGLSLVLGAGEVPLLEMTNAYAVFANEGYFNKATGIVEIVDKHNKTIYSHVPRPKKVLDEGVAFMISSILSDSKTRAEVFGTLLNISRIAAVKTGTTENFKDALTFGFTRKQRVVGVWVGNNDATAMDQIAGSLGAAPIWRALMEKALVGMPVAQFEAPSTVVSKSICRENGLLLASSASTSSAQVEYFLHGTEPTQPCYIAPAKVERDESRKDREEDDDDDRPRRRRRFENVEPTPTSAVTPTPVQTTPTPQEEGDIQIKINNTPILTPTPTQP